MGAVRAGHGAGAAGGDAVRWLLLQRERRVLELLHVRGVPPATVGAIVGLPLHRVLRMAGGITLVWLQGVRRPAG